MRFLESLRIPVAAVLRDSQAYVRSAECGMGIHEMKGALLQEDLDSWKPFLEWLEHRSGGAVLSDGDPLCRKPRPWNWARVPGAESRPQRGLFETLSASFAKSEASSATENATMLGLPSSPFALLTTTMIGASFSQSM